MLEAKLFNLLTGGARSAKAKGTTRGAQGWMWFYGLFLVLVSLLIRVFIVYYAYNLIMPKLITTLSENPEKVMANYRPLTYWEALVLIILVSCLIR